MPRAIQRAFTLAMCAAAFGVLAPAANATEPADATPRSVKGDCEFLLDKPHASHHNPGHVNSAARIKCKTTKKYLGVEVRIIAWQGAKNPIFDGKYKNDSGTARTVSAAATTDHCNYDSFTAEGWFLVVDHNGLRTEEYLIFPKVPVSC